MITHAPRLTWLALVLISGCAEDFASIGGNGTEPIVSSDAATEIDVSSDASAEAIVSSDAAIEGDASDTSDEAIVSSDAASDASGEGIVSSDAAVEGDARDACSTGEPSWKVQDVAAIDPARAEVAALVLADGRPALVHADAASGELSFALPSTTEPASGADWQSHHVDESGHATRFPSVALIAGKPWIAYHDEVDRDLRVARSRVAAPAGPGDWVVQIVDTPGITGIFTSIVEWNGRAALAYARYGPSAVAFARALVDEPTGPADFALHTVEAAPAGANGVSLGATANGAFLAYAGQSGRQVLASAGLEPSQISDWTISDIDPSTSTTGPSLAIVGDDLFVVYHDFGIGELRVARRATVATGGGVVSTIAEITADPGPPPKVIDWTSRALVTFIDDTGALVAARATNAAPVGPSDWTLSIVDDVGGYSAPVARAAELWIAFAHGSEAAIARSGASCW